MRTQLFNIKNALTVSMVFLAGILNAQQWLTTGNAGITPSDYVGTIDQRPLYLRTNGSGANPGQAVLNELGSFLVETTNNTNVAKTKGSIVGGLGNILGPNANSSLVTGWENDLSDGGGANIVAGQLNRVVNNAGKSVALGWANTIRNANQFAIGVGVDLGDYYSGGFGVDLIATGNRSFVFGSGTHASLKLTNNIPSSIMFGLSQNSTMLIMDQRVGVRTNSPTANFHTVGTVRLQGLPNGTGRALVVDANGNVLVSSTSLRPAASDQTVEELQERVKTLENTVEELKQLLIGRNTVNADKSQTADVAVLFQNAPNPAKNETNIKYYLPKNTNVASVEIYSINGQLVKTFNLQEKGFGTITLSINELQAGTYVYKMNVDGRVIDSKKMLIGN